MQQTPEEPNKESSIKPNKAPIEPSVKEEDSLVKKETPLEPYVAEPKREDFLKNKQMNQESFEEMEEITDIKKKETPKEKTPLEPYVPKPKKEEFVKEEVNLETAKPKKPVSVDLKKEIQDKIPAIPVKEIKEKLDLLSHMDVRTMTKDIAKLRKIEAKKERERIEELATKEAAEQKEDDILTDKEIKDKKQKTIADSLISGNHTEPKKINVGHAPSQSDKLFIRIAVAFVLTFVIANIIGLSYYYFFVRDNTPKLQAPITQEIAPSLVIPESHITVDSTVEISFTQPTEVPQLLSNLLKAERKDGTVRIVLKDALNNKVMALPEFFNTFNITAPKELAVLLQDNFTLFIHSTESRNRLGLIVRGGEGITEATVNWEPTMEEDTKQLFDIVGQKGEGYVTSFRTATINQEVVARFQTLSLNNLGIVYTIVDNNFILTSSLSSVEDIIQKLK